MTSGTTRRRISALTQVGVCAVVGVVAGTAAGIFASVWGAPLVAWDAAALTYLIWTWRQIWHLDAEATAGMATIDDPTRRGSDIVLLVASVASLAGVAVVVVHASEAQGVGKVFQTTLGIGSVIVAWLVVHTIYTLLYATLYHRGDPGGVDFNQKEVPRYGDFAYLAFTIGMTFQVSDTSFTTSTMRSTALRHALLSYLFGTVIIATTINVVAGLAR